jgi:hypothetical protein
MRSDRQVRRLHLRKLRFSTFTKSQSFLVFLNSHVHEIQFAIPMAKSHSGYSSLLMEWGARESLMEYIPPKCWHPPSRLHGVITHNMKVRACSLSQHGLCDIWIQSQYFLSLFTWNGEPITSLDWMGKLLSYKNPFTHTFNENWNETYYLSIYMSSTLLLSNFAKLV